MSPLRSTRMGSLPPCKDLCCSSASPFYHLAFFPLCLHFSDFAHSRYLRSQQVSSFTAGIFSHSRYLRLRQVSVFALTVGSFVLARSKVRPRTGPPVVMFWSRKHNTARELPTFPASRYAELVSGGHLPTISGAHISAPAGPCILRQQNMERQVGRQG